MIVWGGIRRSCFALNTGGRYDPATDTWTATSTGAGVPAARAAHTAVWTGTEMIVWGGTRRRPNLEHRRPLRPVDGHLGGDVDGRERPVGAFDHTAVWTGTEMIVWGGTDDVGSYPNTGGRYDPATDTWAATSTGADVPAARYAAHGGVDRDGDDRLGRVRRRSTTLNTGGRYDPATDTWAATSTGAGVPSGRYGSHGGVDRDGDDRLGRRDDSAYLEHGRPLRSGDGHVGGDVDGRRTSRRRATSHTAVWTGTEMIVWGGCGSGSTLNTGGRYDPATDTWAATSTGAGVPAARGDHTAVWTGTEMIVWGGTTTAYALEHRRPLRPGDGHLDGDVDGRGRPGGA